MPCRLQPLPALGRQGGASDRHAVHGIAVIIGAAGEQQTERIGHPVIAVGGCRIVIGVIGLERVETGVAQRGNSVVDQRATGMRQRRQAAGAVNGRDHSSW